MSRRRRRSGWSLGVVVAVVAVVAGMAAFGFGDRPTPGDADVSTSTSTSSASAPTSTRTASASGLRQVHSPGRVAIDEQLVPGRCHVRTVDGKAGRVLPDAACTPGAIDPAVTQSSIHRTICVRGYTATVRPPESDTGPAKHESLADYGLAYTRTIEYDHLVPLELGGTNAVSNLWPEPNAAGARGVNNPKDRVENTLRAAVCGGRVSLAAAQRAIAHDWTTATATLGL
ncbi:MAG TPA: hypothetical protein VN133_13625 [Humibacter sp.]|nr:hypothetical protein [Humibacter sp.]